MKKEREKVVVTGLFMLMVVLWLGFFVHRSPRFAGSLWGGALGVSGSLLMLFPLAYLVIKRIPRLKKGVTRWVPMRTLLAWHIYAGVLGPILVLLHTGHKFDSALGVTLTAMTLIVVASGFIGRYLLTFISTEIRDLKARLVALNAELESLRAQLVPDHQSSFGVAALLRTRLAWTLLGARDTMPVELRTVRVAEAIADTEYALASDERLKAAFRAWLKIHIVLSLALYVLLALHVWAGIHFGLRWFV